jgi:hypothetical protein
MNQEELLKYLKNHNHSERLNLSFQGESKFQLSERFRGFVKENQYKEDDIFEFEELTEFSINEASKLSTFQYSEDMNEATQEKIDKLKEKYKDEPDTYFSVVSEGNRVTQNTTLYSYFTLKQAINDKEFSRRRKSKEIVMQGDHPDWFTNESIFTACATIYEVVWESIDGDPDKLIPGQKVPSEEEGDKYKSNPPETNGKPPIRLYAVFKIWGKHKTHIEDYIKNARLGISSRGYGVGESVSDKKGNFLYYEIKGLQIETWDFVTRPSVKRASFTKDGVLNSNKSDKSLDNPENKSEKFDKSEIKNDNVNQGSGSEDHELPISEGDHTEGFTKEKNIMDPKEVRRWLSENVEGRSLLQESIQKVIDESDKGKELNNLKELNLENNTKIEKLTKDLSEETKIKEALDSSCATMKVEKESLQKEVEAFKTKEFGVHKKTFFNKWNKQTADSLREDLKDCENLESFEKLSGLLAKHLSEDKKVNYKKVTVVEKITSDSERDATDEEVKDIKNKKEDSEKDSYGSLMEECGKLRL